MKFDNPIDWRKAKERTLYGARWDAYWASKRPKENCSVCYDLGKVNAALGNWDHTDRWIPCPMKCKAMRDQETCPTHP